MKNAIHRRSLGKWRTYGLIFLPLSFLCFIGSVLWIRHVNGYAFFPPSYPHTVEAIVAIEDVQEWSMGYDGAPKDFATRTSVQPLTADEIKNALRGPCPPRMLASLKARGVTERLSTSVPSREELRQCLVEGLKALPSSPHLRMPKGVIIVGRDAANAQMLAISVTGMNFREEAPAVAELVLSKNDPEHSWHLLAAQRIVVRDDLGRITVAVLLVAPQLLLIAGLGIVSAVAYFLGKAKRCHGAGKTVLPQFW